MGRWVVNWDMIKPILFLITLTLSAFVQQDVRVITYTTGKVNSDGYESLAFWIKSNQRAYIRYMHGKSEEDVELSWSGTYAQYGNRGFHIRFPAPDTSDWIVTPQDTALVVGDRWGRYHKVFYWENENGAEGTDSVCSICAKDQKQAMIWLRKYFMQ